MSADETAGALDWWWSDDEGAQQIAGDLLSGFPTAGAAFDLWTDDDYFEQAQDELVAAAAEHSLSAGELRDYQRALDEARANDDEAAARDIAIRVAQLRSDAGAGAAAPGRGASTFDELEDDALELGSRAAHKAARKVSGFFDAAGNFIWEAVPWWLWAGLLLVALYMAFSVAGKFA